MPLMFSPGRPRRAGARCASAFDLAGLANPDKVLPSRPAAVTSTVAKAAWPRAAWI